MEAFLGLAFIAYIVAVGLKIITVWDADNGLRFHKGMAAAMVLYGIAAALYISKEQKPVRGRLNSDK